MCQKHFLCYVERVLLYPEEQRSLIVIQEHDHIERHRYFYIKQI